ncbi:MAG: PDZ domain-containing protein [bacterium]|nr:PDZ domain-containing protein [bacterium]
MRKVSAFALLLASFVFAVTLSAQETPEWWNEWHPSEKMMMLHYAMVPTLRENVINGALIQEIEDRVKIYPYRGIGITLPIGIKTNENPNLELGVRIGTVVHGSPAERAGIEPGDWVLTVRGERVCDATSSTVPYPKNSTEAQREEAYKSAYACAMRAAKLIGGSGAETLIEIEHGGEGFTRTFTVSVAIIDVGKEIPDLIAARLPDWERQLAALREPIEKLEQRLEAVGDDDKELLSIYKEFERLETAAFAPNAEIQAAEEKIFSAK